MRIAKRAGVSRRVCPVILIVDASASMSGRPIGQINLAIDNIVHKFTALNRSNGSVCIKFAVLAFGINYLNSVQWVTGDSLVDPDGYVWSDMQAGGLAPMGKAFRELKEVLDGNVLLQCMAGSLRPVFMLFSGGHSTDPDNYVLSQLEALSSNIHFSRAQRYAIGFCEANMSILRKFVSIGKDLHPYEIDRFTVYVNSSCNDIYSFTEKIQFVTIEDTCIVGRDDWEFGNKSL